MAIKKPIWNDKGVDTGKPPITTPSFSFAPNDGLAEMIVEAWANKDIRKATIGTEPKELPDSVRCSRAVGDIVGQHTGLQFETCRRDFGGRTRQ